MNEYLNPERNTWTPRMRRRNGALSAVTGFLFAEANELFSSVTIKRSAAWVCGRPADASTWPFVIRTWMGPPDEYEGLEVCDGAELTARYAWARYLGQDLPVHVWTLLDRRLCPVHVCWADPGPAADGSITCQGVIRVGDTHIGRLSYVIAGADA